MPRPIWSGAISFGLVNVPVKLFAAVSHQEVRFHLLHDEDGARIREKRVCSKDNQEVPYEHLVKGYEISKDQYVTITPDELAALNPEATRAIEIQTFVDQSEIDPLIYDQPYNLVPDKQGEKAYALLLEAMRRSGKVGIARMVLRTRQHLCALFPREQALCLSTLIYADELRPVSELEGLPRDLPLEPRELDLAVQLVEQLAGKFEFDQYSDEHRAKVLELVERKAKGQPLVSAPLPAPTARVVNLADALAASLAAAKQQRPEKGERRHRSKGG
jgi:DNA end-binding protein Ku